MHKLREITQLQNIYRMTSSRGCISRLNNIQLTCVRETADVRPAPVAEYSAPVAEHSAPVVEYSVPVAEYSPAPRVQPCTSGRVQCTSGRVQTCTQSTALHPEYSLAPRVQPCTSGRVQCTSVVLQLLDEQDILRLHPCTTDHPLHYQCEDTCITMYNEMQQALNLLDLLITRDRTLKH